jgi:hypothetical protein
MFGKPFLPAWIFRIIVIFILVALPSSLYSEDRPTDPKEIRLSSDTWHSLTMPDGKGLYFDIIRAVYEPLGIKVSLTIVPYARSVAMVEKKLADGWVASFFGEQPFPLYPKWHFDRNTQIVVTYKASRNVFKGVKSLQGKPVIWLRDFNLDKYIPVPLTFEEIDDIAGAFPMLAAGRAAFFIGAESDIMDAIKANRIDKDLYSFDFLMHLKLYVAFADTERGRKFREIWDNRMATLTKDPEFLKIYGRYGYPVPFE